MRSTEDITSTSIFYTRLTTRRSAVPVKAAADARLCNNLGLQPWLCPCWPAPVEEETNWTRVTFAVPNTSFLLTLLYTPLFQRSHKFQLSPTYPGQTIVSRKILTTQIEWPESALYDASAGIVTWQKDSHSSRYKASSISGINFWRFNHNLVHQFSEIIEKNKKATVYCETLLA